MPMAVGAAVWMFWRSERGPGRQPNPLRAFLLATVLIAGAIGFVVGFGALFPRYSVAAFADGAAELQQLGAGISDQGSYYSLGAGSGALGQVRAAPVAVLTALFRPMVFEARNPLMLAASLENAAFLFLTLYVFYTRRFGVFRTIWRSPALMFCAIYVVALAAATGLTSTNLGTLSRYRMPLIPYFGVMLAVLVPMAPRPGRIRGAAGTGRRARTVVPLRAERASAP